MDTFLTKFGRGVFINRAMIELKKGVSCLILFQIRESNPNRELKTRFKKRN